MLFKLNISRVVLQILGDLSNWLYIFNFNAIARVSVYWRIIG